MKIKIITVGKLKENYLKSGIAEYSKRMKRFAKVEMIELSDERIPDNASLAEKNSILDREGEHILKKIGDRDYVIVLAIEGTQLSSEQLSKTIESQMLQGYSTITFIIGGSLGLSNRVKGRANFLMSFGLFTLPHQLMRLVLIEQIYRTFMIQEGSSYHK